jgi:phenylacetate-CoA ligase
MVFHKVWFLREVLKNSRLSEKKIKSLQNKKISSIVKYAYRNVEYYKKVWKKERINVLDINSLDKLKFLPVINKKTVLRNHKSFVSIEYKNYLNVLHKMPSFLFMRSTSGTSGSPLTIYFNPEAKWFLDAVYARALLKVGYNPFKPLLYYWWQQSPQTELYHLFGIFKKIYVPCEWEEEKQLEFMKKIKPEYIYYYPSALYFISRLVLNQNLTLGFNPKLIITHAELLVEKMRKKIEDAFDCKVFDQYGSNEFNRIGWECKERNGYHIDVDSVIVEIVDENYEEVVEGEIGKVLITGLVNKAFPLIRYEIGDYAKKAEDDQKKHNCGINLPVIIKNIEGRYEHSVKYKNSLITQREFLKKILNFIDDKKEVYKFQVNLIDKKKRIYLNYMPFENRRFVIRQKSWKEFKLKTRQVNRINKNKITGKTLLFEKTS